MKKKKKTYYIPYHAVLCDSSATTKLRVMFDVTSATDTGESLNDLLLKGLNIHEELVYIITRFRS